MNRLQSEWDRLYVPHPVAGQVADSGNSSLIDAAGQVRAMVLELARPADWATLSQVWQGVQVDLELPAPAIAISGRDGYQLWFSLREPVPAPRAIAFLESLRLHYLSAVKRERVAAMPTVDPGPPEWIRHASAVPAPQEDSGHWSAFVAPDLAPVFADEPWLDVPPNAEGQSDLLCRLRSIAPADFERASEQLGSAGGGADSRVRADGAAAGTKPASLMPIGTGSDPRRFLLEVMNDSQVDLALRIEAAKALLPYIDAPACMNRPG